MTISVCNICDRRLQVQWCLQCVRLSNTLRHHCLLTVSELWTIRCALHDHDLCHLHHEVNHRVTRLFFQSSKAGTDRKERRFQERTSRWTLRLSTDRINRWRWSPCPLLVDQRWRHQKSSQLTSSPTLRAEGRNIPDSTEIQWCNKVYLHWSGRHARKTCRWLLECRFEQKFVRFVEMFHKIHSIERKTSQRIHVVRRKIDKNSNDCQTWWFVAWSMDENW